jgi:hypothetical protein
MADQLTFVEQEYVPAHPVAELKQHPKNYREANSAALNESLRDNGFYGAVLVQRSTGYILKGNHTFEESEKLGATTIPVFLLDVDDERAEAILVADNHTSDLATNDLRRLTSLLSDMATRRGTLEGTTYDQAKLDEMLAEIKKADTPPGGFQRVDETLPTEYRCPSCSYEWSGQPKPPAPGGSG